VNPQVDSPRDQGARQTKTKKTHVLTYKPLENLPNYEIIPLTNGVKTFVSCFHIQRTIIFTKPLIPSFFTRKVTQHVYLKLLGIIFPSSIKTFICLLISTSS
jgi:hypothetical protein